MSSPSLEYLPNPSAGGPPSLEPATSPHAKRFGRFWLFLGIFGGCLGASLVYIWLQPPLYQASASILTVAPPSLDPGAPPTEPDPELALSEDPPADRGGNQHVQIQRRLLLGPQLLEATRRLLAAEGEFPVPELDRLREMLSVVAVPNTNLVELRAQGSDPAILAPIVNAWTEAYRRLRENGVRADKRSTAAALDDETEILGRKVEAKRQELETFRRAHDIVSLRDSDNQAMAKLNGLNTALNKAVEEEAQAEGKLAALRAALARGEPVIPPREAQGLAEMEQRAQELRDLMKAMKQRYTPQYALLQPQMKEVPDQLRRLEAAIRTKLEEGRASALSEAEQAVTAARQSVQSLRGQIAALKKEATEFTSRFARHEALVKDLAQLERLYRDAQGRSVKVEAKPTETLPPLQVIDHAYRPARPIAPDYWQESGIALAGSLGVALSIVLLHDLLIGRGSTPPTIKLPDVRVFSVAENLMLRRDEEQRLALTASTAPPPLPEPPSPAVDSLGARELSDAELQSLIDAADLSTRQLLGLLLSGLSLEEAAALSAAQIDVENGRLRVGSAPVRELILAPRLRAWLAVSGMQPAWAATRPADPDELAAAIACAAVDCGIAEPASVDAESIRHTYIVFLVRQGLRLLQLERVVGRLGARTLAGYAPYSPPGAGLPLEAVTLVHPVLATGTSG